MTKRVLPEREAMTSIRTVTIGLPKTWARCSKVLRGRIEHVAPSSWTPHTKPVSTIGEFMMTVLAWEHDQRAPVTELMTSADRASAAMLKGVMPSREAIRRVAQDAVVGPEKAL